MGKRLAIVGLSHKTAPIEVREQAAFSDEALARTLAEAAAAPELGEAMIVSTCNRVELYCVVDGERGVEAASRLLVDGRGLPPALRSHLYVHEGEAAVKHLFYVAASLDSMVMGESQILGQVKEAYARATEQGAVGPLLGRVVPRAFQAAKRVRSETGVARASASVASVAVDLAAQIFGDLGGREVLVVGAGKMGALSARHLKAAGIGQLRVVNRTLARAEALAARLGGVAAPFESLDALLGSVDIVLCSTGAQEPVLDVPRVQRAMKARKGRWLFLIDIAVPRDVDPRVGQIENVYLYDVDALEQVVASNREGRAREAEGAERILETELTRHRELEQTQGVVPTIKLLRGRFLEVAQTEVERILPKLKGADERDRALVKQMAEAIVNKLLHPPVTKLKREAQDDPDTPLAETVRRLFDLHSGHTEEIRLLAGEADSAEAPATAASAGKGGR